MPMYLTVVRQLVAVVAEAEAETVFVVAAAVAVVVTNLLNSTIDTFIF